MWRCGVGVLLAAASWGCAPERPARLDDLCAIFRERPEWYEASRDAARRWRVPVPVQLAVIHQESAFEARARPPRSRILWIFPGPRPSTAYGYGQVLDGTWAWYQKSRGGRFADRDEFEDVVDFIGWYGALGAEKHGISRSDAYAFYLSYHEGHTGFVRRGYQRKPGVKRVARKVASRSRRYGRQYNACRKELDDLVDGPWWWPF